MTNTIANPYFKRNIFVVFFFCTTLTNYKSNLCPIFVLNTTFKRFNLPPYTPSSQKIILSASSYSLT
ncbi:hypothetical protein PF263_07190, partial [Staphylococcus pseudintermedius]|uniref:hypothetical protein n=1 Tax=Staphylococcus pseudintermedius TaxID=283734 RepID=UPI0035C0667F